MSALRKLAPVEPTAEQKLRLLFKDERELLATLAENRRQQTLARNEYAEEHRLLVRPGVESLRKVLGV